MTVHNFDFLLKAEYFLIPPPQKKPKPKQKNIFSICNWKKKKTKASLMDPGLVIMIRFRNDWLS